VTEPDLTILRQRAESGDEEAVDELVELAAEQGELGELRRLAHEGNTTAAEVLSELGE
jgi:hypothetical protein